MKIKLLLGVMALSATAMAGEQPTIIWNTPSANAGSANSNAHAAPNSQQLDALLAPIALYPDQVLSQVMMAATYPLEVVEAARLANRPENRNLQGDQLAQALDDQDWDPSVKALVAFPDILKMLDSDLDWMAKLGDAFIADEATVMDSVQRLRREARAADKLNSDRHQNITIADDQIIIEPANPEIVYVPFYDPRIAYGAWPYPDYPPFYIPPPLGYAYTPGVSYSFISVSPFWGWSRWDWGHRRIRIVDLPRYRSYNGGQWHGDNDIWRHDPSHRRGVGSGDRFRGPLNNDRRNNTVINAPAPDVNRDNHRARGSLPPGAYTGGAQAAASGFRRTQPQLPDATPRLPDLSPPLPAGTTLPATAPPVATPDNERPRFDTMRRRREAAPEADANQDQNNAQQGRRQRQFQDGSVGAPPISDAPRNFRAFRGGSVSDPPLANAPAVAPAPAQAGLPPTMRFGRDGNGQQNAAPAPAPPPPNFRLGRGVNGARLGGDDSNNGAGNTGAGNTGAGNTGGDNTGTRCSPRGRCN